MTQAPWLSVLLPVHKVGPLLDECAASLLDQGVDGIELVFVDDASPGDDARRLADWQTRHPGVVRVLTHDTNQGVAATRNTLLEAARGEYVWFVDPDDLVAPGALAALRATIDAHRPDLVLCDFRTFRDGETRRAHVRSFEGPSGVPSRDRDALVAGLFRTGQFHPWSKIVRRAAWPDSLRFPAGRLFEDLVVYPRLALHVASFIHVPEVWVAYRQREGSILAELDERKIDDWTLALAGFADGMRDAGIAFTDDTLFEVAHFCARTMLRAVRRWRELRGPDWRGEKLRAFHARFLASSPLSDRALERAYWRRGRLLRGAQFAWRVRHLDA